MSCLTVLNTDTLEVEAPTTCRPFRRLTPRSLSCFSPLWCLPPLLVLLYGNHGYSFRDGHEDQHVPHTHLQVFVLFYRLRLHQSHAPLTTSQSQ